MKLKLILTLVVCSAFVSCSHVKPKRTIAQEDSDENETSVDAEYVLKDLKTIITGKNSHSKAVGVSKAGKDCNLWISFKSGDLLVRAEDFGSVTYEGGRESERTSSTMNLGMVINDYNMELQKNTLVKKYQVEKVSRGMVHLKMDVVQSVSSKYAIAHDIDLTIKGGEIISGKMKSTLANGTLTSDLEKKEIGECTVK